MGYPRAVLLLRGRTTLQCPLEVTDDHVNIMQLLSLLSQIKPALFSLFASVFLLWNLFPLYLSSLVLALMHNGRDKARTC